ncbi:MAG: hypothetical protein HPM95_08680 [Alphaproteobacteria bacterium]|nr:hypothetical protein [Alphaproteobacteria bacterium]
MPGADGVTNIHRLDIGKGAARLVPAVRCASLRRLTTGQRQLSSVSRRTELSLSGARVDDLGSQGARCLIILD